MDRPGGEFISGVVEGFYGKPWYCEQRKELIRRLKEMKLNSFLYAPKDDTKHRTKWRELYTDSEAQSLGEFINEAKVHGIDFYYSLSPGLNMIYSHPDEIELLKAKYDQLVGLGCEAFAIQFDDIETSFLYDQDRLTFADNYASAQVAVTNEIYYHLRRPKFLFCPTEYCESRADPSVSNSVYLNCIGQCLEPDIAVMWSGDRVVSRYITEESIDTLARVLRRPPLIWDNLHANDYDKKRVFLGPFLGRPTSIIPKLRGVLLNPNCEYEANYVPMHTFAQWTRCGLEQQKHKHKQKQQHDRSDEEQELLHPATVYEPQEALMAAIRDWLASAVLEPKPMPAGSELESYFGGYYQDRQYALVEEARRIDELASTASLAMDTEPAACVEMEEAEEGPGERRAAPGSPMALSPPSPANGLDVDEPPADKPISELASPQQGQLSPQRAPNRPALDLELLQLLVELYYLPFEHGRRGVNLLEHIECFKDNTGRKLRQVRDAAGAVCGPDGARDGSAAAMATSPAPGNPQSQQQQHEPDQQQPLRAPNQALDPDWLEDAERVAQLCCQVQELVRAMLFDCPNRLLAFELLPYLADLRDMSWQVLNYVHLARDWYAAGVAAGPEWLAAVAADRLRASPSPPPPPCHEDELEPWVHRGGLVGDIGRLLAGQSTS